MRPAPPIPTKDVHTITPEMTPSPTLKPVLAKKDGEISPVSPLPPPSERRPFSYEPAAAVTAVEPQQIRRAAGRSFPNRLQGVLISRQINGRAGYRARVHAEYVARHNLILAGIGELGIGQHEALRCGAGDIASAKSPLEAGLLVHRYGESNRPALNHANIVRLFR